jgi:S-sulfosulfanyl-L-cysteine sulfohydrolase
MIAINVYDQATKERFFPPYSLKEIGGLRIGIVGIASNIVDKTMPPSFSEGLFFSLGREELPPIMNILRTQEKVDLIVLVSHLGFSQDMKLLSEVQGIDICLSGHTHNRLCLNRSSKGKHWSYSQAATVLSWAADTPKVR